MIQKIHDMVLADRRVTERHIASTVGISQERVHSVLTEDLGMTKLSARWVPRLLTADQKRTRFQMSRENLRLFEADPDNFMRRFVTMDETWGHHFDQSPNNSRSGNMRILSSRRRPKLCPLLERSWPLSFAMLRAR
jgi:histone-lysine N-methyltransferase SETMAR